MYGSLQIFFLIDHPSLRHSNPLLRHNLDY
jgi:hypothetical protein